MGNPPAVTIQPKTFPETMAFRRPWRTYQARLLERLKIYMADGRLHVVAAPGSGKTVLGLEVLRRIDAPTLVLAPTITIRDQWVQRLEEHFLPDGQEQPCWVSTDLRKPEKLTVGTYQALHALCVGAFEREEEYDEEEREDKEDASDGSEKTSELPKELARAAFGTVVVDEAHHLRSEWWRTLSFVVDKLGKPKIVALTATPPYDVSPFEWQRYEELCGPVDAEVSVPELVQQGDLCPHQDYVYFSSPAANEMGALVDFRAAATGFVERLKSNAAFRAAVCAHPWMTPVSAHVEEILERPEYASSLVIYLNATGAAVPNELLHTLGLPHKRIPALELEWLEILLTQCLYKDAESYRGNEALLKTIRRELLEIRAIERRKVKLRSPSDYLKLLTGSVTKLKSVEEIVRLESDSLGDELRCVVLTDFIRRSELPREKNDATAFEDVGVVPLFETLRGTGINGLKLGVLSGSVVIIPRTAEQMVRHVAREMGIREADIELTPLGHDDAYMSLKLQGGRRQGAVQLLTAVFERGGITALVGTKSLLGEGWDAPCINTLVLASFVGSYMLSNQMRGRSIRADCTRLHKTANVWHLVCVEPGPFGPGEDYELLVRRCRAFVGVSATGPVIENGTARLGLGQPPFSREQIGKVNEQTKARALDRAGLRAHWEDALRSGSRQETIDGLEAPEEELPRRFVLSNTILALLTQSWFIFLTIFVTMMRGLGRARGDFWTYLQFAAGFAAVFSLPWALLALWRLLRHGTPEWSMRRVGRAVLEGLQYEGSIGRQNELRVQANRSDGGAQFCFLEGGTSKEQAIFLRALRDVLGPIENPRYLLARPRVLRFLLEDYFAVPEVLARKKEFAEMFAKKWKRAVGRVDLVYTRTPEGRRLLLKARIHSLAAAFQKRSERVSCWK